MKNFIPIALVFLLHSSFSICSFANTKIDTIKDGLKIERIELDDKDKLIKFHCSFSGNSTIFQNPEVVSAIEITNTKGGTDTLELIVNNANFQEVDTLVLTAQAPLKDAIYSLECRTFIIKIKDNDLIYKANKKAIFGSSTRIIDMRSYSKIDKLNMLTKSAIITFGSLLLFIIIVPVYRKYLFKKNHINTFGNLKGVNKQERDPFTYEHFKDEDKIVTLDKEILLLETWKTLFENDDVKSAEEYHYLFEQYESDHFFHPKSKFIHTLNNAWFGLLSAFLTFIAIKFIPINQQLIIDQISFIDHNIQISTALVSQFILGLLFGVIFFTITSINNIFKNKSEYGFLYFSKCLFLGLFFVPIIFMQEVFLSTSISNIVGSLLGWIFIGLSLGVATAFSLKQNLTSGLIKGIIMGILTFCFHLLFIKLIQNHISNPDVALFLTLSFFAIFINTNFIKSTSNENIEHKIANKTVIKREPTKELVHS